MHPLESRLLKLLRPGSPGRGRSGMPPGFPPRLPGPRGLLQVSGGADSTALLRLMSALAGELGFQLEVVHFDHGLRPESGREAQWVEKLARDAGLEFHLRKTTRLDPAAGMQAAARAWRMEQTAGLLGSRGLHWSATGHQRDDQQETWLLKFLRGAHLGSLRGMEVLLGTGFRPLLAFGREELRGYLRDLGQQWLEDPSNESLKYKRNRVRHELLPLLNELAGGPETPPGAMARRLEALERQSRELSRWLDDECRRAWEEAGAGTPEQPSRLETALLANRPRLVQGALLYRFIGAGIPGDLDYDSIEKTLELLEAGGTHWELHLPAGRVLLRRGDSLLVRPREQEGGGSHSRLPGDVSIRVGNQWRIEGRLAGDDAKITELTEPRQAARWLLHGLPPGAGLELRPRQDGDRFRPPGKDRPRLLADVLRDVRMPPWQREGLPVLLLEGEVIAVAPHLVDERFASRDPLQAGGLLVEVFRQE
ncbi:MAG: tRNA lysidine(34) synthetase TilS [Deltaproteobacteria bacterium]|nr:tRNA lysidine(34) synthetase TilS [Deltaproteobacteria bacterium]